MCNKLCLLTNQKQLLQLMAYNHVQLVAGTDIYAWDKKRERRDGCEIIPFKGSQI